MQYFVGQQMCSKSQVNTVRHQSRSPGPRAETFEFTVSPIKDITSIVQADLVLKSPKQIVGDLHWWPPSVFSNSFNAIFCGTTNVFLRLL